MEQMALEFRTSIIVPKWDESVKDTMIEYWERQGIVFTETQGDVLHGNRGTLIGNMTSFNNLNLLATLSLTKVSQTHILCELKINTIWQIIMPYERAQFQHEVDTFRCMFHEGETLLRASCRPFEELHGVLLRAASASLPTAPQELLRPADKAQ